jgi:hypothetical protein
MRTRCELEHLLDDFVKSGYRYLHISCHGSKSEIQLTLGDPITIEDLACLLDNKLDEKRLFLSSCSSTNETLANKIFPNSDCYSIIGFEKAVDMNDSITFWSTFYHLLFNEGDKIMKRVALTNRLKPLKILFNVPLVYYSINQDTKKRWKKIDIK